MGQRPRQSLAEANPALILEWHPTLNGAKTPHDVLSGSGKLVWWQCALGHPYEQAPYWRTNPKKTLGCPYCSMQKLLVGFNDFQTKFPDEAKEWDYARNMPIKPNEVTVNAKSQYHWLCAQGHTWEATTRSRAMGRGCHICSNYKTQAGVNDLEHLFPELAEEFSVHLNEGLLPSMVSPGDNRKYIWICPKGHEFPASPNDRTRGKKCGVCYSRRLVRGVNDLASTHPALIAEWDYSKNTVDPSQIFAGYNKKVNWICSFRHEWTATPNSRAGGRGCSTCANQKLLRGFNDFETKHPVLAAQWNYEQNEGLNPSMFFPNSTKLVTWDCPQGHIYTSRISVRVAGSGCPTCAQSGYDPSQAGIVYFIENKELRAFKVGISNVSTKYSRVKQFTRRGWAAVMINTYSEGADAQRVEGEFFRWLRIEKGIGELLGRRDLIGVAGHTETFSSIEVSSEEVVLKLKELGSWSQASHARQHRPFD